MPERTRLFSEEQYGSLPRISHWGLYQHAIMHPPGLGAPAICCRNSPVSLDFDKRLEEMTVRPALVNYLESHINLVQVFEIWSCATILECDVKGRMFRLIQKEVKSYFAVWLPAFNSPQ